MKKILLSLTLTVSGFMALSQAVVSGISPAAIQGNYDYANQSHIGWPTYTAGQTADENWALALDFNIAGTFVQGELELVYDGTPGINPQGIEMQYEGCGTLLNPDLTGKIAIVYRNTCDFASKAFKAQELGAIGLIIINREDATNMIMTAAATGDGPNVTIPVCMITKTDGANIIATMDIEPVTMFIGNKIGVYPNDLGAIKGEFLISPYATHNSFLMDGFDLGIQVYNYGSATQNGATVNATIVGPGSTIFYNQTVNLPAMNSTDTVSVFNGNTEEFLPFDLGMGMYPVGDYTLTYTISPSASDDAGYDNVFSSEFSVSDDRLSLARNNGGEPVVNSFPSNTESEYQSCTFLQDSNASLVALKGVYFAASTDTSLYELEGAEIFINVYEWDDAWVDINDPNFATNNDFFASLNLIAAETYYPASDDENRIVQYVQFASAIELQDNQRYLVCNQTYDANISFGYDNALDYGGNIGIFAMPSAPIQVDQAGNGLTWFIAGWNGSPGNGIMLDLFDSNFLGLNDKDFVNGKAFPNPTSNNVTIALEATGNGQLTVTDVAGKIALNQTVSLVNGKTNVDMSNLDAGVYIFNVILENGKTSQFNVVKN
ncbi:MAG: T9SS type A sorting domain-containing protein [Crocinitomicaceae bacterium]